MGILILTFARWNVLKQMSLQNCVLSHTVIIKLLQSTDNWADSTLPSVIVKTAVKKMHL